MEYTRRAVIGTVGAALFVRPLVAAEPESDFVLAHAGREMVRLHTRFGQNSIATGMALAASNLRLLAAHPYALSPTQPSLGDEGVTRLHRELRRRHGFTGTEQDIRKLTTGAPLEAFVNQALSTGKAPQVLLWAANAIDRLSVEPGHAPASLRFSTPAPQLRHVQYDTTGDYGPDMQHYNPCDTMFAIESALGLVAIGLTLTAAGALLAAMAGGIAIFFSIVRYGGC
jgi:hypothetical protein